MPLQRRTFAQCLSVPRAGAGVGPCLCRVVLGAGDGLEKAGVAGIGRSAADPWQL